MTGSRQAGAEIEVTPEMIAAGARMIADEYGVCGDDIAESLARDVFVAMLEAKGSPS